VRALFLARELFLVGRDGGAAVEHVGADVGHEFREAGKLVADLVRELARVAENDDGDLAVDGLAAGQRGKGEWRRREDSS
jgi:hypothetical protein